MRINKRYKTGNLMISITAISMAFATVSCGLHNDFRQAEGIAWNTMYHITYECAANLSDSIIRIFEEIDASLSPFNENSIVSRINDNRSDSTDNHFAMVYKESQKIHKASDGAFDPTLAPLIRAWGFGQGHEVSADTLEVDSLLTLVGIDKTKLTNSRLIKTDPRIEFNFSALAKGYGVDCIADMLERNGCENYLVEVGGEIRAAGHNRNGSKWSIGIDSPESEGAFNNIMEKIYVSDAAIATSGNYRNFHQSRMETFGHTISATTGRPIKTDILSATVIARTCMEADALATCCMAIGSAEAMNLCTRMRAGLLIIKTDFTTEANSAFKSFMSE